ncbi:MAG: chitobiase/beta-hexosaminidase C-terminal domain-containing protein [Bacteroidaceae bacterium]|nr:chitobiase/beta-hexosaminidase C-terminal domain-containing protein [Bacteroidaceae bacterium]
MNQHLKALHIRFLPDQTAEDNISSREFIKKAEFVNVKSLLSSGNSDEEGDGSGNGGTNGGSEQSGSGESGSGSSTGSESGGSQNSGSEAVTAPEISGTTPFTDSTQVTIQGPQGAALYYTTDGSTPTSESMDYSEPITLSATTTVKAIAILNGETSAVASKTFTKSGESGGFDLGN